MGLWRAVWVEPDVCVLSVRWEHLAAMATGARQVGGAVAVARKVGRVEACQKSKLPSPGPLEAPGGCTGR